MEIDLAKKTIKMSAREFAGGHFSGRASASVWRALIGKQWHCAIREESELAKENSKFEIPILKKFSLKSWNFEINGFADQLIFHEDFSIVREIKTTEQEFPISEIKKAHLAQLAVYLWFFEEEYKKCQAELLYVNIFTGKKFKYKFKHSAKKFVLEHANLILEFIHSYENAHKLISKQNFDLPYESLREGQSEATEKLKIALSENAIALFEAPTAFGKSAIAWHIALEKLKSGQVERIVWLSSKASGQQQALSELKAFIKDENLPKVFQLRNRNEHILGDSKSNCVDCENCEKYCFGESVFSYEAFFEKSFSSLFNIKKNALEFGLCPYEISISCLSYAQVWVCDLNYLFAPSVRNIFDSLEFWNPKKTFLIIDEAHNLYSRVEGAHSGELSISDLQSLKANLLFLHSSESILPIDEILQILDKCEIFLEDKHISSLKKLFAKISENLFKINFDELNLFSSKTLWNIAFLNKLCTNKNINLLWRIDEHNLLKLNCIDAKNETEKILKKFNKAILMSANAPEFTLAHQKISATSSWLENAFEYFFDNRINTSYKKRSQFFEETAHSIALLAKLSEKSVVVFFPSYAYAKSVAQELEHTHTKFIIQEKNLSYQGQEDFLKDALKKYKVIFLILGSSYSESIDVLGGKVDLALVVGVALPELNPISDSKVSGLCESMTREQAFEEVYVKAGILKIKQAIGRLVRSPKHKAKVIFHCERFLEKPYIDHLHKEFSKAKIISNFDDLKKCLIDKD